MRLSPLPVGFHRCLASATLYIYTPLCHHVSFPYSPAPFAPFARSEPVCLLWLDDFAGTAPPPGLNYIFMGQNQSSSTAVPTSPLASALPTMADTYVNLCPAPSATSVGTLGPAFSSSMSSVTALDVSRPTPMLVTPAPVPQLLSHILPRQTSGIPPDTCNASLGLSLAESCFANDGCQSIFDQIWRCWQSWNVTDEPSQYQQPQLELMHCCLCGDFFFNVGTPWSSCRECMMQNVTNGAGIPVQLTLLWASLDEASQILCSQPTREN